MSFNRVPNAFEINFRSTFSKDIGLQFLTNLLSMACNGGTDPSPPAKGTPPQF